MNEFEHGLCEFKGQYGESTSKIESLDVLYKRLKKTNFIKEVFYISSQGEFGTISGFRMGRLPTTDVKWDEINAAIG